MNVLVIVIIVIVAVFFVGGGLGAWFFLRNRKKYGFLLYSRNGRQISMLEAQLKTDPENRARKKFFLDSIGYDVDVKEPTKWIGGKAYREIIQTKTGDYVYIKSTEIDEKEHIKVSVSPEEKIITLNRFKDNQRRYQNPMSKGMAGMFVAALVLAIIIIIGIVYSTIAYAGASKDMVELAKENSKNGEIIVKSSANVKQITEQLVIVTGALTGDANITRTLG